MTLLSRPEATIPSDWYYDEAHYRRELETIWYQDWICVGREESLPENGDFFTTEIGDQSIIVARSETGLRAWLNTCRHRGSRLCESKSGRFRNGRIICPYHTWTYGLDGTLVATPNRLDTGSFDPSRFSLYDVHVANWRGFVFICLADEPSTSLVDQLGDEADQIANWPMEDMRAVHRVVKTIESNWKIYWENYNECYHCPRAHPSLCKIMPLYKKATAEEDDIDGWTDEDNGETETWSPDGKSTLPLIDGLSDDELGTTVTFASFNASWYIVAHRDYMRSVLLVPRGPEKVDLIIDWYLPSSRADTPLDELRPIIDFPLQVIDEDGSMCELNQKGIRGRRHKHGYLVEQEQDIWDFHEWLRQRLG